MESGKIVRFWKWFSNHYKSFGEHFENEELLDELNDEIALLGDFAWEVGPGSHTENQFVVSPGGDPELLRLTQEIVAQAPDIPEWEFYNAKPPKQWDLIFDFEDENGATIEINASAWRYQLLKYADGTFEVIIETRDLADLNETDKITVSEILLDGILGEEVRMKYISYIEIIENLKEENLSKHNIMSNLASHFKQLIS